MKKADNYTLYLSGLINEAQLDGDEPQTLGVPDTKKLLDKLSIKFGQKANTYRPLIVYLKNKPDLLALLDDLMGRVGEMKSSTFSQVKKQA